MFREMRRNKQALTAEEVTEILKRNTSGVLAVNLLQHGVSNRVIGMKHGKVYHEDIEKALKARRPFNRSLYNTINGL